MDQLSVVKIAEHEGADCLAGPRRRQADAAARLSILCNHIGEKKVFTIFGCGFLIGLAGRKLRKSIIAIMYFNGV